MFNEIYKKIKEYDNIVIVRHIGVDPDALCSQIALRDSILLTFPNKNVIAIGNGSGKFSSFGKLDKIQTFSNALLIVCDTPDMKRLDSARISDFSYSIKIDHHPFIEKFCDLEYIDDTKTSASEIILSMIFSTPLLCNLEIASTLYAGIVSDSNRFLFNNTSTETFSLLAKLLKEYPISLEDVYKKLYMRPLAEVRLEGYIASNMIVTEHGLGYIVLKNDLLVSLGVDSASPGNMVNHFNYIKEVIVWATITEDVKNGVFRISIRSRGPIINELAEKYYGGGHKMASGARVKTLEEALHLMEELDELLNQYTEGDIDGN